MGETFDGIDKPNSDTIPCPVNFQLVQELTATPWTMWTLRDFPEAIPLRYCFHYPLCP
jgi:hypothetical protein